MDKKDIRSLTKFIPALCSGELFQWYAEPVTEETVASARAPVPEYWDVVYRFADAVLEIAEKAGENGTESACSVERAAVDALAAMIRSEEECPGVLAGYIKNGTLVQVLKRLESLAEQLPD